MKCRCLLRLPGPRAGARCGWVVSQLDLASSRVGYSFNEVTT